MAEYDSSLKAGEKYNWFEKITGLPHPRFIMQYKLKFKQDYIENYIQVLQKNRL